MVGGQDGAVHRSNGGELGHVPIPPKHRLPLVSLKVHNIDCESGQALAIGCMGLQGAGGPHGTVGSAVGDWQMKPGVHEGVPKIV